MHRARAIAIAAGAARRLSRNKIPHPTAASAPLQRWGPSGTGLFVDPPGGPRKASTGRSVSTSRGSGSNFRSIDCVRESDPPTNTHTEQSFVVLPAHRFWTGTMETILHLMASKRGKNTHKIVVFFELKRLAQLYARFLSLRLGHTVGVWETHGGMHPSERTRAEDRFRRSGRGVLLASGTIAGSGDLRGVSHLVQVGAPRNRATYLHRLGRTLTGGAGTPHPCRGILVLPEPEQAFVWDELGGLGVGPDHSLKQRLLSRGKKSGGHEIRRALANELGMLRQELAEGREPTGMAESVDLAYRSLVSHYFQTRRRSGSGNTSSSNSSSNSNGREPPPLGAFVDVLNQLVRDFGPPELPAIDARRAESMGIDRLPGLNIRKHWGDPKRSPSLLQEHGGDSDEWFALARGPGEKEPPPALGGKKPR
ncbi:unnamed protein product [Pseudo-nitzschia multistriata]|uniref:ATP-dependent RNA helicase n=1 Tax=Pseudo-nitzschia multistriata TaxID=183589 RepID=A0A448ZMH6_9STRA|nr:unnamed protein product [Pseudo-nitzschia multistriata]